jgi:hypothetical protein
LDAYEKGFVGKLVWVKPFGLNWDYYELSGKIQIVEDVNEIAAEKTNAY